MPASRNDWIARASYEGCIANQNAATLSRPTQIAIDYIRFGFVRVDHGTLGAVSVYSL